VGGEGKLRVPSLAASEGSAENIVDLVEDGLRLRRSGLREGGGEGVPGGIELS
jgi:hypothetical protein